MDPTAPNNNGQSPQTPVQPGQFVVAGDDAQPQTAAPVTPQQPAVSLAGQREPGTVPQTPMAAVSGAAQPDPTPFSPPTAPPMNADQPAAPTQSGASGGGSKTLLISLAVILLIAIIGAVGYFFVMPILNGKQNTPAVDEQIVDTSPPPARNETDPGFGEIPESTTETGLPPLTETSTENPAVDPLLNPAQ